jgi:hypothetical protein
MPRVAVPMAVGVVLGTVAIFALLVPLRTPRSPARETLARAGTGAILVRGSMGHEWQYEASPGQDIRPYTDAQASGARAVVCFVQCDDLEKEWISHSSVRGLWLPR